MNKKGFMTRTLGMGMNMDNAGMCQNPNDWWMSGEQGRVGPGVNLVILFSVLSMRLSTIS
jgi:hypothetical protein